MMRQQVTFISTTHKSIEEIASTIIHSARLASVLSAVQLLADALTRAWPV